LSPAASPLDTHRSAPDNITCDNTQGCITGHMGKQSSLCTHLGSKDALRCPKYVSNLTHSINNKASPDTRRHKTIICPRYTTAGPAALGCSASDNSRGAIINMHETACCSTLLCAHGEALVHASWVCSIGRSLTAHASHPAAQHEQAAEHSARSQPLCKRQAGRYLRCLFSQVAQSSPSLP
jgi:hypothetical protein